MTNIDDVLGKLDKKTREGLDRASELVVRYQKLPSVGLNRELEGGLRHGSFHLFWGPTGSGKSLCAYETIALAQKEGKSCALVDAEHAFSKKWAEDLGINTEELIIIPHNGMEFVTNKLMHLIRAGIDVVVVDSISELIPPGDFEKDGEIKEMNGIGAIGSHARGVRAMLNKLSQANDDTCIILISQQTTNITPMGGIQEPQGGNKLKHLANTSIKFASPLTEKERITGDVKDGDLIFDQSIGRHVNWQIVKARGKGMHARGSYDIYFAGDILGIDKNSELITYGIKYGIIEKGGAWLTVYGERIQGKANAITYLKDNPQIAEKLEAELDEL